MINVFRPFTQYGTGGINTPPSTDVSPLHHSIESLTRDVQIKPLHSHNDYWRKQPLFDALSFGCQSVEGDIWYFPESYKVERTVTETTKNGKEKTQTKTNRFENNEIYVGHNQVFLEPSLTLSNLYLDPLYRFLKYSNPTFIYHNNNPLVEQINSKYGVFYNSPETPLYLWLDFKTDPHQTYEALKPLLQPFIDEGFLAHYDATTDTLIPGPLVITITGNVPVDQIEQENKRYVFVDAPLKMFKKGARSAELSKYSKLSVIASASMQELLGDDFYNDIKRNEFKDNHNSILKLFFTTAHAYNLKTRIWGGVTWPNYLRDSHMRSLWELGCDLLNVDNLKDASDVF